MDEHHLPVLFPVPKDYRRQFVFEDSTMMRNVFQYRIVIDCEGIHVSQTGVATARTNSLCLDWIAHSIYQVREELEV